MIPNISYKYTREEKIFGSKNIDIHPIFRRFDYSVDGPFNNRYGPVLNMIQDMILNISYKYTREEKIFRKISIYIRSFVADSIRLFIYSVDGPVLNMIQDIILCIL